MSEGFLSRWSRRKLDREPPGNAGPPPAPPTAAAGPAPEEGGDDFSLAQLRAFWRDDPALAAPDPLDMHNLDYPLPDGRETVASNWRPWETLGDEPAPHIETGVPAGPPNRQEVVAAAGKQEAAAEPAAPVREAASTQE